MQGRLLRLFVRRGLLPADDAQAMAHWDHGGGFSLERSVRIAAADRAERERLLRYCARPPFALVRLSELDPEYLLYESAKPGPGASGPLLQTPLQLLDRLATLVPPPRVDRHRYFAVLRCAGAQLTAARRGHHPRAGGDHRAARTHRRTGSPSRRSLRLGHAARPHLRSVPARVFPLWRRNADHRPSSPIRPPFATSSSTSANPPRIAPPAARRCKTCPMPGRISSTFTRSRHLRSSSINASLGNFDRRAPAARDAGLVRARGRRRAANSLTLAHPGVPSARAGRGRVERCYAASDDARGALDLLSVGQGLLARQRVRRAAVEDDQVRARLPARLRQRHRSTNEDRELPRVLQSPASAFSSRPRHTRRRILQFPAAQASGLTRRATHLTIPENCPTAWGHF